MAEIKIPVDRFGNRVNYVILDGDHFVTIQEYERLFASRILKDIKAIGQESVANKYDLDETTFNLNKPIL